MPSHNYTVLLSVLVDRHQQGRSGDDRRAGGVVFQRRADSPVTGDAGHFLVMGTTDPSSFPPVRTPCSLVLFLPYLVQQVQYLLSVVVDRHQQGRRGDDRRAGGLVFQGRADSPVSGDAGHGLVMGTAFCSSVHLLHTLTCSRSVNQKRLIV